MSNAVLHSVVGHPVGKAYQYVLENNGAYRFQAIPVPMTTDEATARLSIDWTAAQETVNGEAVTAQWYLAAQQRLALPLYTAMQAATVQALPQGGTLADLNTLLSTIAGQSADVSGLIAAYQAMLEAATEQEFRHHVAIALVSLAGRQGGGG